MKILFFIDGFRKGGKERRLAELLNAITGENVECRVVVIHPAIEYELPDEIKDGIVRIEKRGKKDLRPFFRFHKICKEFDPDIVHTWSSMVTFYSLFAVALQGRYLVNSQITDSPAAFRRWSFFGLVCRINFFFSGIILANSFAGLNSYGAPASKSMVIYNGTGLRRFDIAETSEEVKKSLKVSTRFCAVMVASFSENKDYSAFIGLAGSMQKTRNDITFIAVGDGENLGAMKGIAGREHVENILFLGKRDDVERIISIADVGILLSVHGEGISNSIIEYMAMGKPVIANDSGGTREILSDGKNGYLLSSRSVEEAAGKLSVLINEEEVRLTMGKAARRTIEDRFTISRMAGEFLGVYRNSASRK